MSAIPGRAIACTPSCCRAWPTTPGPSRARRRATSPTSRPGAGEGRGLLEALAGARRRRGHRRRPGVLPAADDRRGRRPPRRAPRSGRRQRPASAARGRPGLPDRVLVSRAPAEDPARATSTTFPRTNPLAGVRLPPAPDAGRGAGPLAGGAAGAPHRRRAARSRACRSITTSRRSRRGAGPRRGRPG